MNPAELWRRYQRYRCDVPALGLSLDVSEDIFGRWCDACSRLAQTTGAWLVRFAPARGRGLILLKDPSRPQELQVFSSLGMGSDYPNGVMITPFLDEHERRDPIGQGGRPLGDGGELVGHVVGA